jgi:hypothetical protein
MVDRFYQAALAHGGKDNGAPGERVYHPGYYAAFVLDPDGNNIEAVYHKQNWDTHLSGSNFIQVTPYELNVNKLRCTPIPSVFKRITLEIKQD